MSSHACVYTVYAFVYIYILQLFLHSIRILLTYTVRNNVDKCSVINWCICDSENKSSCYISQWLTFVCLRWYLDIHIYVIQYLLFSWSRIFWNLVTWNETYVNNRSILYYYSKMRKGNKNISENNPSGCMRGTESSRNS